MNCREFSEQMYEVAFGEAERSASFDQHMAGCGNCRQEFELAVFSANGIASAPPPPAPSLSTERLRTAILSHSLRRKPSWIPRLSFAGAAAALALAAWLGFNQPGSPAKSDAIAAVTGDDPALRESPSGPIVIPERTPEVLNSDPEPPRAATVAASEPKRSARRVRNRSNARAKGIVIAQVEASQVPDDLLAVVVGGAESALDSDFAPLTRAGGGGGGASSAMIETSPEGLAAPAPAITEEKPIVVIQPKGKATERSSDDVPIGG